MQYTRNIVKFLFIYSYLNWDLGVIQTQNVQKIAAIRCLPGIQSTNYRIYQFYKSTVYYLSFISTVLYIIHKLKQ